VSVRVVRHLGGQSMVGMNIYPYGDRAVETAARETALWRAWIHERFPMPTEQDKGA